MGMTPSCGGDCSGAPLLPAAYVVVNLAFNIAILSFLRTNGALPTSLITSLVVPLTIFTFTFDLPLIGAASNLGALHWMDCQSKVCSQRRTPPCAGLPFFLGVVLLLGGLGLYNVSGKLRAAPPAEKAKAV